MGELKLNKRDVVGGAHIHKSQELSSLAEFLPSTVITQQPRTVTRIILMPSRPEQ